MNLFKMFLDQWKNEKAMDVSSDEELYDSDQIDSDVEAELYSVIHHETDNSTINFEDSYCSINTSNKENNSTSSNYKEFSASNDNHKNSTNAEIIEIAENFFADDKIIDCDLFKSFESLNKNKFIDSLKASPLKRKSDLDCIAANDSQSYCKKQKNDKQNTSEPINNRVNSKLNKTVAVSSSDDSDDNDLIRLGPLDKQKHFETNVSQIIVTDSDSDSADSWCFKSPINNTSTPSNSKTKGVWFVNDDDLYRSRRSSSRYHATQLKTCNRCDQKGHSSKFCSFSKVRKCFICGGKHGSYRCKNKICAKCFGMGHDIKFCPKAIDFCEMCQMPGHHSAICPDIWRRFQRATPKKQKKIWRLFQDTPFFCYNCGLPGHFGALCKGPRMNSLAFPTWPFALNYRVRDQAKVNSKVKPVKNMLNGESSIANGQQEKVYKGKNRRKKEKRSLPDVVNLQQISFPRTPKNNQTKPEAKTNSADKNSKLREKQTKQENRRAKRWRRKQKRREMLLQREAAD